MLARAPPQEEEEAEATAAAAAAAAEGAGRWVTARVLGIRTTRSQGIEQVCSTRRSDPSMLNTTRSQGIEYKVSLDGYDSENDEWMEGDDH